MAKIGEGHPRVGSMAAVFLFPHRHNYREGKWDSTQKDLEISRIETVKVLGFFSSRASHAFKVYEKLDSFVLEMTNKKGLIKIFSVIICLPSTENN